MNAQDKDCIPCCGRESTVVEILEERRNRLIEDIKKLNDAIKHYKNSGSFEQEMLKTVFREGQRPY